VATFLSYAPYFIAEEEGYFAEQGLAVEFVHGAAAPENILPLAHGELDVWAGGVVSGLLNAVAREGNLKVVGNKGYIDADACTYFSVLADRDLIEAGELDSPSALSGRRIGMIPASLQTFYLSSILQGSDVTVGDMETVDLPNPAKLEAMRTGSLDLVITAEPWVTRILETGNAAVWMPAEEVLPDFHFAYIVFGPTVLEEKPEAGRRFMVAYLKAVRQYNQGKTERNMEILAKHTGLDRELLEQACWPAIRNDGWVNPDSLLEFQAWAIEEGFLDRSVTEDEFWDPSFVEYANEELGEPSR
jgi:NitT/TauT family transport system substrate-binding protein